MASTLLRALIARRSRSLLLFLLAAFPSALGQSSVTVQIVTDSLTPGDFGTAYSLGQLSNSGYTYGPNFIIEISYDLAEVSSLSLSLTGSQADYVLAWRVAGTSDDHPFTSALGADVTGLSGSATDLYYRNDGTLQTLSTDATRYRLGAKSTPSASEDLQVQVTLTATLY